MSTAMLIKDLDNQEGMSYEICMYLISVSSFRSYALGNLFYCAQVQFSSDKKKKIIVSTSVGMEG